MVGCFGDIPIYVFGNFGAAKSCGELTVAQSEFSSPMYIYIHLAAQLAVVWGMSLAKYRQALD